MIAIIKNQLKRIFSSPGRILVLLILPVAFMVFSTWFHNYTSIKADQSVAIVDYDQSSFSKALVNELGENFVINLYENEEDAGEAILSNEEGIAFVIPENFQKNLPSGQEQIHQIVLMPSEMASSMSSTVNSFVNNIRGMGQIYGFEDMDNLIERSAGLGGEEAYERFSRHDSTGGLILGVGISLMIILFNAQTIAFLLIEDRRLNTTKRIRMAKQNNYIVIFANILVGLIIFSLNLLGMHISLKLIMDISLRLETVAMIIMVGLIFLLFAIFLVFTTKTKGQVTSIFSIVVVISCMLGGCYWSLEFMTGLAAKLSKLTPQYWVMTSIDAVTSGYRIGYWNFLPLIGFLVFFISLAAYRLKAVEDSEQFI